MADEDEKKVKGEETKPQADVVPQNYILKTQDNLEYVYNKVPSRTLRFKVKCANDAHILLSQTNNPSETDPVLEIFIGGWANQKSAIRRDRTKPDKAVVDTPDIVSNEEFRGFWIKYLGGAIAVGKENEVEPFLTWTDPAPINVAYFGVCTGYGATGEWVVDETPDDDQKPPIKKESKVLKTQDNLEYVYNKVPSRTLRFKVKCANDAHIMLSQTNNPSETDPVLEIFIGGWANQKSVIRRDRTKPDKAGVATPDIVSNEEFRGFWIKYLGGAIAVGKENEVEPFLTWTDPAPINVAYFGVRTGYGATGEWVVDETPDEDQKPPIKKESKEKPEDDKKPSIKKNSKETPDEDQKPPIKKESKEKPEDDKKPSIKKNSKETPDEDQKPPIKKESKEKPEDDKKPSIKKNSKVLKTQDNLEYVYNKVPSRTLRFKVKCANDAHIMLSQTNNPSETDPVLEIFIGGWANQKSAIRRDRTKPDKAVVDTPDIVSNEEFRGFWIKYLGGAIAVGKENEVEPFLTWTDPAPINVAYFGVCTGYGATGEWVVDETPDEDQKPPIKKETKEKPEDDKKPSIKKNSKETPEDDKKPPIKNESKEKPEDDKKPSIKKNSKETPEDDQKPPIKKESKEKSEDDKKPSIKKEYKDEEKRKPEKSKTEEEDRTRRLIDSKGNLLESESFVMKRLQEYKKRRAEFSLLIKDLQIKINEHKTKEHPTDDEIAKMKKYHLEFLEKLAEYETITQEVVKLTGLPDVPTSQLDMKMSAPTALKPPKTEESDKKEKPKVALIDSIDEMLPKVIVCGTNTGDTIPRIIVCEPLRKKDLEPFSKDKKEKDEGGPKSPKDPCPVKPSTELLEKLNKEHEARERLACENAQLTKLTNEIKRELHEKQDILDCMKKKMLALQCENLKVMRENDELKYVKPKRSEDDYPMCKRELFMKYKETQTRGGLCCRINQEHEKPTPREINLIPVRHRRRSVDCSRPMSPILTNIPYKGQTITYMGDVPPNLNMENIFSSYKFFDGMSMSDSPPVTPQQPFCKDLEKELEKMGGDVRNIYCELDNLQKDRYELGYGCSKKKPPVCKRMLPHKSTQTDVDKEHDILFASEKDPKLQDLREQYKRLHSDFKIKVSEVAALRVDLDKTKTELESLTIIHHELEAMHQKEVEQNTVLSGEKKQVQTYKEQILDLEQQASQAKQLYMSCRDDLEESQSIIEEQANQLDDYRNKYMKTLQIAEELKSENEHKERECADQLAVEIQKVKQELLEQLEELSPIKDLLKITQQKLTETEQMHNVALETIADMSQRMEELTKELETLRGQKTTEFDGEAASNLALSLEKAEKRLTELEAEISKHKEINANLESVGSTRKQQLDEKSHEVLQLISQLETLREESARQVARVKERSDMIRKCLQAQIAEMEKEIAQARAATAFANRERDEMRCKLQCDITLLCENFRESQNRIVQLQQHVDYLNATCPTSFLNLIK